MIHRCGINISALARLSLNASSILFYPVYCHSVSLVALSATLIRETKV